MTANKCKISKWICKVIMVVAILIFAMLFLWHKFYTNNLNHRGFMKDSEKPKTQDELYAEYFILRKDKINPFSVNFTILEERICEGNTFLIMIIPSKLQNTMERIAIRSTWAMTSNSKVKHVFLVGRSQNTTWNEQMLLESAIYKDIVQGDFVDSYFNLTLKILMGLKWSHLYCYDASFILKADDDTFVHTTNLLHVLQTNTTVDYRGLILGNLNKDGKVKRSGLWKVGMNVYPFPHYPKYMFGNTYVISRNIANRLLKASEHMPYIPIEDAYITGILAKSIRTEHQHVNGFAFWYDSPPNACDFVTSKRITATKASPQMMELVWLKINSNNTNC